jgi:8-oxo-dGTP pyrophosphatase MutT (NUDIX family)
MTSRDGNGWVRCDLGHRHWGRFGAAGLLAFVSEGGPVLLQQRTWWSHHGGTWGLPGGARDSHETVLAGALREAAEECGVPPEMVAPRAVFTDDHGGWSYTTVLAEAATPFEVESDYDETADVAWVDPAKVTQLSLHPGFAEHWEELRAALEPVTIIVDGANVVGSRPDGWWRDRAGAALRLRAQLEPLAARGLSGLPGEPDARPEAVAPEVGEAEAAVPEAAVPEAAVPASPGARESAAGSARKRVRRTSAALTMTWLPDIVLVVEGAARAALNSSEEAGSGRAAGRQVRMVAAPGSGDDAIAALAAQTIGRRIVVTADRELKARCIAAGAQVAGPGWLLRQL